MLCPAAAAPPPPPAPRSLPSAALIAAQALSFANKLHLVRSYTGDMDAVASLLRPTLMRPAARAHHSAAEHEDSLRVTVTMLVQCSAELDDAIAGAEDLSSSASSPLSLSGEGDSGSGGGGGGGGSGGGVGGGAATRRARRSSRGAAANVFEVSVWWFDGGGPRERAEGGRAIASFALLVRRDTFLLYYD